MVPPAPRPLPPPRGPPRASDGLRPGGNGPGLVRAIPGAQKRAWVLVQAVSGARKGPEPPPGPISPWAGGPGSRVVMAGTRQILGSRRVTSKRLPICGGAKISGRWRPRPENSSTMIGPVCYPYPRETSQKTSPRCWHSFLVHSRLARHRFRAALLGPRLTSQLA